jgi:hypothetical protein
LDVSPMERSLILTIRAAKMLYDESDIANALRVMNLEALPMMAACVSEGDDFESFEPVTLPVIQTHVEA